MKTRFEIDTWNNSAIDLYSKGKIQTSLNLFQYVLRKDPSNETTNYYIKLIYNEKYESKIKTYLKEAESLFEKKLYQEAARVYDKIFKLNPYYPGIKEKKQEAMFLDSERKKEEALAKETAGQVFSAILLYQEAVQIYPENKSAKESLFRLRQKLTPQIPEYHEKGLDLYNKRRYADSISIYENILLIDSEDKRAKEYLRLSKEKKEALHKLMNCKIDRENPCKL
jgi:tetratricopeptide (TPR) repeat protein